jgi:hypothetical protein
VLEALQERSRQRYVPADHIARIYAGLGETDQAVAWLEKAYAERASRMIHLKVEPTFDRLRSDRRFQDLLRRMGLPP